MLVDPAKYDRYAFHVFAEVFLRVIIADNHDVRLFFRDLCFRKLSRFYLPIGLVLQTGIHIINANIRVASIKGIAYPLIDLLAPNKIGIVALYDEYGFHRESHLRAKQSE